MSEQSPITVNASVCSDVGTQVSAARLHANVELTPPTRVSAAVPSAGSEVMVLQPPLVSDRARARAAVWSDAPSVVSDVQQGAENVSLASARDERNVHDRERGMSARREGEVDMTNKRSLIAPMSLVASVVAAVPAPQTGAASNVLRVVARHEAAPIEEAAHKLIKGLSVASTRLILVQGIGD